MTAADWAAVDRFMDALRGHEDGHHQTARDFLAGEHRTITADGATRQEAMRKLQQAVNQYQADTRRTLDARTADYDRTTGHGANQQAVGGTDAHLTCP